MSYVLSAAEGSITVNEATLNQIVVQAADAVDGARVRRPRRHLELEVDGDEARVELALAIAYGKTLPDVAREVQQRVAAALGTMCGLSVTAVDVSVEELDH
jgi:uncharacterized alkaline shock family protein YloU